MVDTSKLTEITPEQQAEFDGRRVSDAVVQTKCGTCGAWYETPRGNVELVEPFTCECGQPMVAVAPPIEGVSLMLAASNLDLIEGGDGDARLDTGMTVKEAISRAQAWWDKTGAKLARREKQRRSPRAFTLSMSPDDPNGIPSNILNGRPWDALRKPEKLSVVKVWHHFYARKPDLLGGDADERHLVQERNTIQ